MRNMRLIRLFLTLAWIGLLPRPLAAQTFSVLHNFNPSPGPVTPVVAGPDGALYGVTPAGGSPGEGLVYKINPNGTGYTNLHSFTGGSDGANPVSLLISGNTLYGTTVSGGVRNNLNYNTGFGTVFKINFDGSGFATIYSFTNGTDGSGPGPLTILGNTLYGLTGSSGLAASSGSVFKLDTNGSGFAVLHDFVNDYNSFGAAEATNNDGLNPKDLTVSGGTLYGIAQYGGLYGDGTIFTLNINTTNFSVLHAFTGGLDGNTPEGLLLSDNLLYVTTFYGGTADHGTVDAVSTGGLGFTNLYSFTNGIDGGFPESGLIVSGGTLYGTAASGGTNGDGTVFSLNTVGNVFTPLHNFQLWFAETNSEGAYPPASLLLLNGTLYGTAGHGGITGAGTIYSLTPGGAAFTTVYNFPFGRDGSGPDALVLSGNTLYGTTAGSGSLSTVSPEVGTIFQFNADGTGFASVHKFSPLMADTNSDGAVPDTGLCLSGNTLYVGAGQGGALADGTLFSVNANGTGGAPLYTFTGDFNGYAPRELILSGNTLYGMAYGGTNAGGTLFMINTNGVGLTNLYSFPLPTSGTNSVGSGPDGLVVSGGTCYGVTTAGGTNGEGTVFKINTTGNGFTLLHTFAGNFNSFTNIEGYSPRGDPVLVGNTLYGTAFFGGTNSGGTIFQVNTDGTGFAVVHSFPFASGNPVSLVASGNTLYGVASGLNVRGFGSVFRIGTDGNGYTNLYNFTAGTDGAGPTSLILSGNTLYGVAGSGGNSGFGTVFSISLGLSTPQLAVTHTGNQVIISWPASITGWALQTNTSAGSGSWGNYAGNTSGNSVTNSPPKGNLFFRLTHP
jgi:uncharacterized repeat protein (TIGR03803 family)